ncbi:hypothetical protein Nepgr_008039 [Nepenthes gracilis]|uniref:Uncharacterized protein n=1 Tax=Nepenthes gracilis TaxID=150966 RepID=A0AAD3S869_NEPGR|nr:hypothetical protein Nepgr_008039 [Nepenthes gracilis]
MDAIAGFRCSHSEGRCVDVVFRADDSSRFAPHDLMLMLAVFALMHSIWTAVKNFASARGRELFCKVLLLVMATFVSGGDWEVVGVCWWSRNALAGWPHLPSPFSKVRSLNPSKVLCYFSIDGFGLGPVKTIDLRFGVCRQYRADSWRDGFLLFYDNYDCDACLWCCKPRSTSSFQLIYAATILAERSVPVLVAHVVGVLFPSAVGLKRPLSLGS